MLTSEIIIGGITIKGLPQGKPLLLCQICNQGFFCLGLNLHIYIRKPIAMANQNTKALILTILLASLIAGTLDGLAAVFILAKGKAAMVFKYIASAVYGKQAFAGGSEMIWTGVALHYLIAALFTVLFFILYDLVPVLRKRLFLVAVI
jgi:hypothetical protein